MAWGDIRLRERARVVADATRRAIADPEDTAQVFRIAEAMSVRFPERLLRRVQRSDGRRLLDSRDDILAVLTDRPGLEAMPPGSLARTYLGFVDAEGITAEGLVKASEEGAAGVFARGEVAEDVAWVRKRMRDTHDLWHAVTGYQGDLIGETALLAFTFAQTGHPGIGFLTGLGLVLAPHPDQRRLIVQGFRRGRRAAWLPAQDWRALLPLPVDEVRRQLRVGAVPTYAPVREPTRTAWWRRRAVARA